MLPTINIKVEGMDLSELVDTGASASFLQMDWSKQNTFEIYTSKDAFQVWIAMGQQEMVSKQAQTNVEIASLNIPHNFLVSKISLNCIFRSDFLAQMAADLDFQVKELCLHQGDKIGIAPV